MAIFVDWHHTKKLTVLTETEKASRELDWGELVNEAEKNGKLVYLERGCPRKPLVNLLSRDIKIGFVDGKALKDMRDGLGQLKTHEGDVEILRKGIKDKTLKVDMISDGFMKNLTQKSNQQAYQNITKFIVRNKNQKKAIQREFPEAIAKINVEFLENEMIKPLEKIKSNIQKEIAKDFKTEKDLLGLKGIAETLVGLILTIAHPKLFSHHNQYLKYCGMRGNCGEKYSREAKTLFYLCVEQIIKMRTPKWRETYDKIKKERLESPEVLAKYEELKTEKVKKNKKHFITFKSYVERTTKNRVATLLCKHFHEIYG